MSPSVPFAWRAGNVRAAGVTLATFEAGSDASDAPVVLLLHGLGHWSEGAWSAVVPRLDRSLRYVAFDLPGFGASAKPAATYDTAFFHAVLDGVAAALGLGTFALVGHSLGGFVAAEYAGAEPRRVTRLALLAPAGVSRAPRHVAFAVAGAVVPWAFTRPAPERVVRRTLARSVADPAALAAADVERAVALAQDPAVRRAFAAIYAGALGTLVRRRALHAHFARYRGPVWCGWGARDRFSSAHALRDVARIYPQARTALFARSGHLPMVEEPDAVAAELRAFLA